MQTCVSFYGCLSVCARVCACSLRHCCASCHAHLKSVAKYIMGDVQAANIDPNNVAANIYFLRVQKFVVIRFFPPSAARSFFYAFRRLVWLHLCRDFLSLSASSTYIFWYLSRFVAATAIHLKAFASNLRQELGNNKHTACRLA